MTQPYFSGQRDLSEQQCAIPLVSLKYSSQKITAELLSRINTVQLMSLKKEVHIGIILIIAEWLEETYFLFE